MSAEGDGGFSEFLASTEPRLRHALVAMYGSERGREAVAEALAHAWEHWESVRTMKNRVGYLFRVGQSRTRPGSRAIKCAQATHLRSGDPDALPERGQTSRAHVRKALLHSAFLIREHPWLDAIGVQRRDGQVWHRNRRGEIVVSSVRDDFWIVVELAATSPCPTAPVTVDGVPVRYLVRSPEATIGAPRD